MNTNRILLAGLVGGIFAFFFGWLLFGIILSAWMPSGMTSVLRPEADMVMWAMGLSNILWGIFLAYIFVQWANISTWQGGAWAGAIIGFFISAAYDTGFFAMTTMYTLKDVAIDVALNTVYVAVTGAVIGLWLGWKK
jgi:hypothetical protein